VRRDRTIADIGADHGLRPEAAKRAAARAGIFRRGRLEVTLRRDQEIVRRAETGITRREVADEFGLSLSHVYYVLRLARHDRGSRVR
jgi:DNA invertase Pin-like site-specific DNA recombinase